MSGQPIPRTAAHRPSGRAATTPDRATIAALKDDPTLSALRRSLDFYYGDPARDPVMDAHYARFVGVGDLVFDIGAHVGDRIGSFRRLGARVVAVEPQPLCARAIRAIYASDEYITLVEAACGAEPGTVTMHINSANPTVSTASAQFVRAAAGASGWDDQIWDSKLAVPATTLDALIDEYGLPAFTKIDVEGFEDAVLAGLSYRLPTLSFEFTTIERGIALRCLDRLASLGHYGFDVALGESRQLTFHRWVSGAELAAHLLALPHAANSGDIYCVAT